MCLLSVQVAACLPEVKTNKNKTHDHLPFGRSTDQGLAQKFKTPPKLKDISPRKSLHQLKSLASAGGGNGSGKRIFFLINTKFTLILILPRPFPSVFPPFPKK